MVKLKFQYFSTWWEELTHWKRPWCWERLKAGGEGDDRGWDGWMASLTGWTLSLSKLLEFAQTYVHRISDAIQPSHPLSSPSPLAFSRSRIKIFSNESALHIRWAKYWSFSFSISLSNENSGLISFGINWFDFLTVQGSILKSSPAPQFKGINS